MRLDWAEWEATVEGAPFAEGRPRGDRLTLARDLERLRALTVERPGLRVVVIGDGRDELVIENGRFGIHDVALRRFLDDARAASQVERRPVALLEVRVRAGAEELRFVLAHPTPTAADAFLRSTGAGLYERFALAPLEGEVLLDGEPLGSFDDALRLGDLGERARRRIA